MSFRLVLLSILVVSIIDAKIVPRSQGIPIPIWDCPPLPTPPPATNVNQLRPGNIKVVMAVGDSITAGFGMLSGHFYDLDDLVEYRGHAFAIGGDEGAYTVPNFLKTYNPDIEGASIKWSWPLDAIKWEKQIVQPWDPPITKLNGAQSMAKIAAVPDQVDYVTNQILTTFNTTIDMQNDWKLMTVFIGANNICPSCSNESISQPDYYENMLNTVLAKIQKQIPRTFVNLVTMFNISQVYDISMSSEYCRFMWDTLCKHECGCMTDDSTPQDRQMMDVTSVEFNKRIYKVASEWQAKGLSDFTVKVQPFLENMKIPVAEGLEFLSQLDCFHPGIDTNIAWALGLWNNMLTPDAEKATGISLNITVKCPTQDTFLQ